MFLGPCTEKISKCCMETYKEMFHQKCTFVIFFPNFTEYLFSVEGETNLYFLDFMLSCRAFINGPLREQCI